MARTSMRRASASAVTSARLVSVRMSSRAFRQVYFEQSCRLPGYPATLPLPRPRRRSREQRGCVLVLRRMRCVQQGLEDGSGGGCPGWTLPPPLLSEGRWWTRKEGKPLGCGCHRPRARQSPGALSILLKKPCAHPIKLPGPALPNPPPRRRTASPRPAPAPSAEPAGGPRPPPLRPTCAHRRARTHCQCSCFRVEGLSEPISRLPREH